jgi:hypothetical protein
MPFGYGSWDGPQPGLLVQCEPEDTNRCGGLEERGGVDRRTIRTAR